MRKQDMRELLERIDTLTQKQDRELADSVLEVSIRANRRIVEELRGDGNMCQALLEIMEPAVLYEGTAHGFRCIIKSRNAISYQKRSGLIPSALAV